MNDNILSVPETWHPQVVMEALTDLAIAAAIEATRRGDPLVTIVEIGTWLGHSAIALARGLDCYSCRVYCVDHWHGSPSGTGLVDDPLDLYDRFWRNIREAGVADRVTPIFESSARAAPLFAARPIDLLYIDGDHSFQAVMDDLINWAPLVRAGGVICGDDFGEFGPARAVNLYFAGRTIETRADGRLFVVRG